MDGRQVEWLASSRMRAACLVFIAIERDVSRDRLIGLFWPEVDDERARASLSQTIYTIRRSLGEAAVLTDGDRVRIGPDVDVDAAAFVAAAERGDHASALQQYDGRFLNDTPLSGSAEFEQWVDAKRVVLERLHRRVRRELLDQLAGASDRTEALAIAQRWCDLDPDEDEAHHRYIAMLIEMGRRTEAVRHFEQYRERLRAEDLEPLEETTALIASLRVRRAAATHSPGDSRTTDATASDEVLSEIDPAPNEDGFRAIVSELRRRRVVSTVGMYLLLAWGAIQVSTTVFPLLELPLWGPRLIVVLALIGLPFVALLSWQYDVTSSGLRRASTQRSAAALPRLTPRWATLAIVVLVLFYGGWMARSRFAPAPLEGTVAVFPFCVTGSGLENEADDIAVLLARTIDAIPELQSADPYPLLTAARAAQVDCTDTRAAGEVARKLGAVRFIIGSLTRADNEIRADATLYDVAGEMKWAATTSVPSTNWLQVVDSLARKIVEKQGVSKGDRMLSVAAITTRSNGALRAYLEGERKLRALGWIKASEEYAKAVAIDSTFALAWFRLAESLSSGGGDMAKRREALTNAKRHADMLPEREQRLLHAFDPFMRGVAIDALDRLYAFLAIYPDDPQAWFWLGEAEYSYGQFLGHDQRRAVKAYRRSAELGSPDALFMLAWAYMDSGEYASSDSVTKLVLKVGAGGEWVIGIEAAHAYRSGDRQRIDQVLTRVEKFPAHQRSNAALWAEWAHKYALSEQLAERAIDIAQSPAEQAEAKIRLYNIRKRRGKQRAADQVLAQIANSDPKFHLNERIDRVLDPWSRPDVRELQALRPILDSIVTRLARAEASTQRTYDLSTRLYQLGRISTAMRDFAAAERYAARVQSLPGTIDAPTGTANIAASLRAHVAIARGDTLAALKWLDAITFVHPFFAQLPGVYSHEPERKLRADILVRRGDPANAAYIYSRMTYDGYSLQRTGQLFEQSGDRATATKMYVRLRDLLDQCDPEFLPLREFAQQRLAALRS